jgi:hypothetical protein
MKGKKQSRKKQSFAQNKKARSGKPSSSEETAGLHLGSSNAFEETEDPGSPDPDNITDEKLDEELDRKFPEMGTN